MQIPYKVMRTESGKKQHVRLKENKKVTKKIDAPVIAYGAELIKDKEGELSCSVDGSHVDEWASMAASQRKRRVREKKLSEEKNHSSVEVGPLEDGGDGGDGGDVMCSAGDTGNE